MRQGGERGIRGRESSWKVGVRKGLGSRCKVGKVRSGKVKVRQGVGYRGKVEDQGDKIWRKG